MKKYIKGKEIKNSNQIVIITESGDYIINPTEETLLEDGWKIYSEPEKTLKQYQKSIISKLIRHDSSKNVNSFFIGDKQAWIDRDTRVSLMNSTTILKNTGQETTTLWLNGDPYTINCELLIQLLGDLEIYAIQCYNITEQHKSNI